MTGADKACCHMLHILPAILPLYYLGIHSAGKRILLSVQKDMLPVIAGNAYPYCISGVSG